VNLQDEYYDFFDLSIQHLNGGYSMAPTFPADNQQLSFFEPVSLKVNRMSQEFVV
jgi:hypothetical protein